MIKYKEALNYIAINSLSLLINQGNKDNELIDWHYESVNLLQELIDKETPMKVINEMYEYPVTNRTKMVKGFECPNCHQRLHTRYKRPYCAECGQKLDWGDSND